MTRSMLIALAGAPFQDDVERALLKIERALPAVGRKLADRLPRIVDAKARGRKKQDARKLRDYKPRPAFAMARLRLQKPDLHERSRPANRPRAS